MNTGDRVRKICIATWELKEFTPGGIGVLVHNILHFYGSDPRAEISILWYGHKKLDPGLFAQAHPNCRLFLADEWIVRDDDASPSEIHASSLYAQRQTLKLMRALKSIEAELGAFDFIEFPDFDGAALSSLQERRLGRAFQNTKIVVRIHSTEAVLRAPDYRPANPANAVRVDMERKALRDADLVVGHLQPVVDDVAAFFALGEAWRKKVLVEHPPVFVEQPGDGAVSAFGPIRPLS